MTKMTNILCVLGVALSLGAAGCDDAPDNQMLPDMSTVPRADMNMMQPTGDMAIIPANYNTDMLCYNNPTVHLEIINSCADGIERLEKNPVLTKLNPDGTRPPLP